MAPRVVFASAAVHPVHHRMSVIVAARRSGASDRELGARLGVVDLAKGTPSQCSVVAHRTGPTSTRRAGACDDQALRREQEQHPGRDAHRAGPGPALPDRELRAELRDVGGQLARRGFASRGDRAQRLGGDLPEPGFPATGWGHALLFEHPDQARALGGDQRLGAGLVHHRRELDRHDEQRSPHPEHPDERAAPIQRVLEVGRFEAVHPCPRREEDRRGIARVQADDGPAASSTVGRATQAVTRAERARRSRMPTRLIATGRTRGRFGTARRIGPRPARGTSRAVRPPRRRRRGPSERSSRRARPTASPGPVELRLQRAAPKPSTRTDPHPTSAIP